MDYLVERNFDYSEQDGKPVLIFRVDGKKQVVPLDKTFDRKKFEKDAGITLDTLQRSYYDRLGPEGIEKNKEELARRRAAAQKPDPAPQPAPQPAPAKPAPQPAPQPAPAAAPKPTDRYRELIAQGKTKEAEAVGKEIWAKKYAGKFTVPSVEKSGPRIDVSTAAQNQLFSAAERGVNLPRVRSTKDDIKDLRKIRPMPEAYDVVLDYLLSEGHADTVEEAHYVMMQMDAEYIQDIIENVMSGPVIKPVKGLGGGKPSYQPGDKKPAPTGAQLPPV